MRNSTFPNYLFSSRNLSTEPGQLQITSKQFSGPVKTESSVMISLQKILKSMVLQRQPAT
jgi:hypothetical protein